MQTKDLINEIKVRNSKKILHFAVKRAFDFLFSVILLIILSPLFIFIIAWIKFDSKGEAIFKQTRVGLNEKDFTIYKFRTMVKDADKMFNKTVDKENLNNFVFQDKDDPRITASGRFLRKTSLDELPQLFNIIIGNMSLIGPRPEIPAIAKFYSDRDKIRLMVKPGVSGLAQVNGRSELELGKVIEYDIEYAKTFSIWLDFKILLRTVKVVLKREGAY